MVATVIPGEPGRYAVDFGSGVTVELDAEGNLDAALLANPKKNRPVLRVRLLGEKTGEPMRRIEEKDLG